MKHSLSGSVLEVLFDDIDSNNALDLKKAQELSRIIKSSAIRLILLRNKGRVFCSGGNLKDYASLKSRTQGLDVNRKIRKALESLAAHPALKIAYVEGDCFGGGIELLSCFDLIYSSQHVFFGMWQRRMALSFGWGGYERLSQRLSSAVAKEWLLTGDVKTAFWAKQNGLLDGIMDESEITNRIAGFKSAAAHQGDKSFETILRDLDTNEAKVFETLWGSKAHLAHLDRFTNRTQSRSKGRSQRG